MIETRNSQNRLLTTLGFFMQGLPAIFVQSEIAVVADRNMQYYLKTTFEKGKPDFSTDEILKGYELFITSSHELRHFHDALLSPPLFQIFLLQNARLWHVVQLPHQISGLTAADLPFQAGKPIRADVTPFGRDLINQVHTLDRAVGEQHRSLYKVRRCLGNLKISLVDLLESNAIAAELLHLMVAHDIPSAELYYKRVVRKLPPEYHKLLDAFFAVAGNLAKAVIPLHLLVAYCLYGSNDPVARFCVLAEEYAKKPDGFTDRCGPQKIRQLFDQEAEFQKRVQSHKLVRVTPEGELPFRSEDGLFGELTRLHENVYAARKALIAKYIHEFEMNASHYYRRTDEMPLPPMVLWPGEVTRDGRAFVIRKDIFKNVYKDLYMIRGTIGNDDERVLAGIGPYNLTRKPFIDYEVVDICMLAYYFYRKLFSERTSEVYTPVIDEVYEDVFMTSFDPAHRGRFSWPDL